MIELRHEFRVDLPINEAWAVLTDLPRVAKCMRGAALEDVVDGEYRGGLSTRIGPVSATFRGVATFQELDEVTRRAVVDARGREAKGSGSANALVTMELKPDGEGTVVHVTTELAVSGKMAQFGRSMMTEVSNSLVEDFTKNLEKMIAAPDDSATVSGTSDAGYSDASHSDDQFDVLSTIALPMLRRAAVPAVAAFVGLCVGLLFGRGRRRRAQLVSPSPMFQPYPSARYNSPEW
ncbi:SRPBCC family protein [Aeromicrobium piscarium]|uniref:Carbon monoxide dehydrogenase n=1 Tax=Aeromicrobium piscarium TaxID=2590901 RepID=A0A554RMC8_9ACTN|nr:SRPBCC family protein [Aeromicrobium piscarium]TSD55276.1 carbon monoxide dehydrogenase [Aeromicrobium piscarium]